MKSLSKLIVAAAFLLCSITASCAQRLFSKFADRDGIQCVYVGQRALKNLNVAQYTGIYASEIDKVEAVEVVNTYSPKAVKEITAAADKAVSDCGLEVMTEVTSDGMRTTLWTSPQGKTPAMTIILSVHPDNEGVSLIAIHGDIDINKLSF